MRIDWWTLGLQSLNLLVLVWILSRFLFRPIARIVAERQAEADRILAEAKAAKMAAEDAEQQARAVAAEAASKRGNLIDAATRDAERQKQALLADARAEADRLRDIAMKDAERIQADAEDGNDQRASRLAVDIAARLVDRLPYEAQVSGFVEGLANAVSGLPQQAREELAASTITVRAPRSLSGDELNRVRTALAKVLNHDVTLAVQVDPGVLAGLEIETPHADVRNSFRNDLQRISARLATGERADD